AAVARRDAAAGPAVQEHGRLGAPRTDALPVERVAIADLEEPCLERLDLGIEEAQCAHALAFGGHSAVSWSGCWKLMRSAKYGASAISSSVGWPGSAATAST